MHLVYQISIAEIPNNSKFSRINREYPDAE